MKDNPMCSCGHPQDDHDVVDGIGERCTGWKCVCERFNDNEAHTRKVYGLPEEG